MSEQPTQELRGRRAEGVADERRRRQSEQTTDPTLERFGISAAVLDMDQFVYRAALDKGMRIHNLTARDDWDFVNLKGEKADKADSAGVVRYQADVIDGKPVYSYLLRKLKRYADADRLSKVRTIVDDQKARLTQGKTDDPVENVYVPKT